MQAEIRTGDFVLVTYSGERTWLMVEGVDLGSKRNWYQIAGVIVDSSVLLDHCPMFVV